jgi:hypothetical protein
LKFVSGLDFFGDRVVCTRCDEGDWSHLVTFLEKEETCSNVASIDHILCVSNGGFELGHDCLDGCSFLGTSGSRGEAGESSMFVQTAVGFGFLTRVRGKEL